MKSCEIEGPLHARLEGICEKITNLEVHVMYGNEVTSNSFLLGRMMQVRPRIVLASAAGAVLFDRAKVFSEYALGQDQNVAAFNECTPKPCSSRRIHTVELIAPERSSQR